jgi:hypothetical protein
MDFFAIVLADKTAISITNLDMSHNHIKRTFFSINFVALKEHYASEIIHIFENL